MKYYLGIDLGTDNIGYAFTDEDYQILKFKRRAIGVLRFKSANTAAERRVYRVARRRLMRRRFRIDLLQEIFNDHIMKKDENFLHRLNENDLKAIDRTIEGKYSLFNDKNFNDKIYYKKYPTIYHLREQLMKETPSDIRLLYLAIHHIIKYRGHFLFEGEMSEAMDISVLLEELNTMLANRNEFIKNEYENEILDKKIKIIEELDTSRSNDFKDLISNQGEITKKLLDSIKENSGDLKSKKVYITKKDKKQKAYELLDAKSTSQKKLVDIIFGDKVNIATIFGEGEYPKKEVQGFYFSDDLDNVEDFNLLNEDDYALLMHLKLIYDWYILTDLLQGETSISKAMVRRYNEHKSDLKMLKSLIRTYDVDNYEKVFGHPGKSNRGNYTNYIGGGIYDGKKIGNNGRIGNTCTKSDFFKFIKKIVESIKVPSSDTMKDQILSRIENGKFLPKIVSTDNSNIPHQLNLIELEKILSIAYKSSQFAFLQEKENGWTNKDKIKSLLTFRIPYFVGPVKYYNEESKRSKNAWAVRRKGQENKRVTPWTFDEVIDKKASNEVFITRSTNKCTYLKNARTLPKNSVLFSKFLSLNELNKLKINGEVISVEVKQKIFDNVYLKEKVSVKKIYSYLTNILKYDKNIKITGFDQELKANMHSYLAFKAILGEKVDSNMKMVEELIFISTIHQDSRAIEEHIKEKFASIVSEDEIRALKRLRFTGWGSLSAEFLEGYKHNGLKLIFEGEFTNIVDIMYDTNFNLQQIIYDENCNFAEALKDYNEENGIVENTKITYDDIEEMYCSPSVKKAIWQAFELIKDIVKQTKIIPDKIFIESTRTNTDVKKGKSSKTRRNIIEDYYKEAKNIAKDLIDDLKESLKNRSDNELKSEKVFLYFMQLGRCMYTNEQINLNSLFSEKAYDVDHIIPRCMLKDDSWDNKVLVSSSANKAKGEAYPVPYNFRQMELWQKLLKANLISSEKYARLIRKTEITEQEQTGFINRQLVETSQSVLLLRDVLERHFKGVTDKKIEIVLSKAGNVSDFRKSHNLIKLRELNEMHHCVDAYLNIVVGDLLNKRFNHSWNYNAVKNDRFDKSYNFEKYLNWEMSKENNFLLKKVQEQINNNDYNIVEKLEEGKGELYGATIFPAEDSDKSVLYGRYQSKVIDSVETKPKSNPRKYGGYKTSGTKYFVMVDSMKKQGKTMRTIEAISIFDDALIVNGKETIINVLEKRGLINPTIARIDNLKDSKLYLGSLLDFGGYRLKLVGSSGNSLCFHNANQLFLKYEEVEYLKELVKIKEKLDKISKNDDVSVNDYLTEMEERKQERTEIINQTSNIVFITKKRNLLTYDLFISKLKRHPYRNIPAYSGLVNKLVEKRETFNNLTLYDQVIVLLNVAKAFQCNALLVDISKLFPNGENKFLCNIIRTKIINDETIYFISQSKSGLKEKKINISS